MSGTDILIWAGGVLGVVAFGFGLGSLIAGGVRRRRPAEIVLGVVVALLTVWLLMSYGDRILR